MMALETNEFFLLRKEINLCQGNRKKGGEGRDPLTFCALIIVLLQEFAPLNLKLFLRL
jgi:hypothetical protein